MSESKLPKWHLVSEQAAKELTAPTTSPNIVYSGGINGLPDQLLGMPGQDIVSTTGETTASSCTSTFRPLFEEARRRWVRTAV